MTVRSSTYAFLVLAMCCSAAPEARESGTPASTVQGTPTEPALGADCGDKGRPDCPLESWMKANLQSQLRAGDFIRLEQALAVLAAIQHLPYADWPVIAADGARAAAREDQAGVRKACKTCHDQYRKPFRRDMPGASLP